MRNIYPHAIRFSAFHEAAEGTPITDKFRAKLKSKRHVQQRDRQKIYSIWIFKWGSKWNS